LAMNEKGLVRDNLLGHAAIWYDRCAPQLSGLVKAKIDRRRQEIIAPVFTRLQTAVKTKKFVASPMGGDLGGGGPFTDIPEDGVLLVGFEVDIADYGSGQFVKALRPIWQTPQGDRKGEARGGFLGRTTVARAKDGYAVGSVTTLGGTKAFEGIIITFM